MNTGSPSSGNQHICTVDLEAWTVQTAGFAESDGFARVEVLHKAVRI